jgi:hypothetical protein
VAANGGAFPLLGTCHEYGIAVPSFVMYTVIETDIFVRYAETIWEDGEREAFIAWLAANPLAGDVRRVAQGALFTARDG